jgi:biotin operon repressor
LIDLPAEAKAMLYERSKDIESRLGSVLELISLGEYSTPGLAAELGVSIPTVSRAVTALRQRGHDIRSLRAGAGWRFTLVVKKLPTVDMRDNSRFKPVRTSRDMSNLRTESA